MRFLIKGSLKFKDSLVYIKKFQASQGLLVRPDLKGKKLGGQRWPKARFVLGIRKRNRSWAQQAGVLVQHAQGPEF